MQNQTFFYVILLGCLAVVALLMLLSAMFKIM